MTMRIAFLEHDGVDYERVVCRPAVMNEVVDKLTLTGVQVDLLRPEAAVIDIKRLTSEYDLYVLNTNTPLSLSYAGALTIKGAVIVNRFQAVRLNEDKIVATIVLAAAGLPVLRRWATGRLENIQTLLDQRPLQLSISGYMKNEAVYNVSSQLDLPFNTPPVDHYDLLLPWLAQEQVAGPSTSDIRVNVIGNTTWVNQPLNDKAEGKDITTRPLSVDLRALALQCGQVLGLDIYGVDLCLIDEQYMIRQVTAFPQFDGDPDISTGIANYLYDRMRSELRNS